MRLTTTTSTASPAEARVLRAAVRWYRSDDLWVRTTELLDLWDAIDALIVSTLLQLDLLDLSPTEDAEGE